MDAILAGRRLAERTRRAVAEDAVVERIRSLREQGHGVDRIARRLNELGVRHPESRGGRWHGTTVARLLDRRLPHLAPAADSPTRLSPAALAVEHVLLLDELGLLDPEKSDQPPEAL